MPSFRSAHDDPRPATSVSTSANTARRPIIPSQAAPPQQAAEPCLPDEVLEALARDPPRPSRLVAPSVPAWTTTSSAPVTRQGAAFDKSYLFDVPSLVGSSGSKDFSSSASSVNRRPPLLRNVLHSRNRSLAESPSFESRTDAAAEAIQPTQPRDPSRSPYSSAWSRIAAASIASSERSGDTSQSSATSARSERFFANLPRAGAVGRSDLDFHLPTLETGSSPGLERALAELTLTGAQNPKAEVPEPAVPAHAHEADLVIAVLGPKAVGKSTLIRRGLKRAGSEPRQLLASPDGHLASSTVSPLSIGDVEHSIQVVEVDSGLFTWSGSDLVWPVEIPPADGILLCYDASDPDALSGLSRFLRAVSTRDADSPLIVLACKSSAIGNDAIDPQAAADLCDAYGAGIIRLDGGTEDPQRKSKDCFSWVIKQIMENRGSFTLAPKTPLEVPS